MSATSAFTSTVVGMLLCFIFFGGTLAQAAYYFLHFPRDGLTLKTLITSLLLLDAVKAFLHAQLLWYWFINHHADANILLVLPSSYTVHFIISAACVFLVQGLYIRHIYSLLRGRRRQLLVTGVGVALAIMSLACGFVAAHDILSSVNDIEAVERVEVSGRIQGYTTVAVDVYISLILCIIFRTFRTGYEPTENILSRLMIFTINRGILLFAIQLLVIVTYKPNGTQALDGIYCFAGTLNVNCALATLNSRWGRGDIISSQLSSLDMPSVLSSAEGNGSTDALPGEVHEKSVQEKVHEQSESTCSPTQ